MLDLNFYKTIEILGLTQTKEELLDYLEKLYEECGGNKKLFKEKNPIKSETYTFKGRYLFEEDIYEPVYYDVRSPWGAALYEENKETRNKIINVKRYESSYDQIVEEGHEFSNNLFDVIKTTNDKKENMKTALANGFHTLTDTERNRLLMYISGMTMREIAAEEGVAINAVETTFKLLRGKFMNKL